MTEETTIWQDIKAYTFTPWRFVRGELCRTSSRNWRQPLKWSANAGVEEISAKVILTDRMAGPKSWAWAESYRRPRVALSVDVFDDAVPDAWRTDLFTLMRMTQHLDWLLLTRHVDNAAKMLPKDRRGDPKSWGCGWVNVWIGSTARNQKEADRDIPTLLATPAAVRFVSLEPLLGQVDISRWLDDGSNEDAPHATLDWIIAAGKTGASAQPTHPDWVRSLRDQCLHARVPFFFKGWGRRRGRLLDDQSLDDAPNTMRAHKTTGVRQAAAHAHAPAKLEGKR